MHYLIDYFSLLLRIFNQWRLLIIGVTFSYDTLSVSNEKG